MKLKMPSSWSSYVLAVAATIVAAWLHVLAAPFLGDHTPFITFFPAICVTAYFAGFGPTLLAVVLSGLTAAYCFMPPENSILPLNVADWTGLVLFSLSGVGIALLSERMQRSTAQLKRDYERTPEKPENPIVKAQREERIVGLTNRTILIAKDGSERAIDISAAPIWSTEGQIVGSVLVFHDATRQRESQRASGRLAAQLDSYEDAIIGQDLDGFVTDWNAGTTQRFRFSAEETIGKPIFSTIVPPELKIELLEILHRIEQGERVEQFETVRQCNEGSRIPVSIRITPIHNPYGEVIGASALTVRLPVTEEPAESGPPPKSQGIAHCLRILVVDDNVGASYLLCKLLENLNEHQVETAHDGPSAVEKIKQFHPDLVLLDIGLPGLDGYEVAQEIRKDDRFNDVLLVALTGYDQDKDKQKSKEAGFDEHLVKPPSMNQMQEILSHPRLNDIS